MNPANMNRDQAFSTLNHMIAIAGALLATNGGLAEDTQQLIIGFVAAAGSLGLSAWFNVDNLADVATSTFRKVIMLGGTYAVGHGWVSNSTMEILAGILLMGATYAWSMFFYRNEPGPNLPGTTIVDPPPTLT